VSEKKTRALNESFPRLKNDPTILTVRGNFNDRNGDFDEELLDRYVPKLARAILRTLEKNGEVHARAVGRDANYAFTKAKTRADETIRKQSDTYLMWHSEKTEGDLKQPEGAKQKPLTVYEHSVVDFLTAQKIKPTFTGGD